MLNSLEQWLKSFESLRLSFSCISQMFIEAAMCETPSLRVTDSDLLGKVLADERMNVDRLLGSIGGAGSVKLSENQVAFGQGRKSQIPVVVR